MARELEVRPEIMIMNEYFSILSVKSDALQYFHVFQDPLLERQTQSLEKKTVLVTKKGE